MVTTLLQPTPIDDIPRVYETVVTTYRSGRTRPLTWRSAQLVQLSKLVQESQARILEALSTDLGKAPLESAVVEVANLVGMVRLALAHLEEWAAPDRPASLPAWRANWDCVAHKTPKGAVLIISPWNGPIVLSLGPLVGAIAAGCTAVLKPSELAPASSALLAELVPRYLDGSAYAVIQGAAPETTRVLEHRWDHILFTGGARVARIVAAAAARFLTPITLELGGKTPVVIDDTVDLDIAARRILYGKQLCAGQVCVAPDYVLVPRARQDTFVQALLRAAAEFWPEGSRASPDLAQMIHGAARERLVRMLAQTCGTVVLGGGTGGERRMEITIVRDLKEDDVLMEEETFGPVLAVSPVDDIEDALRIIKSKPTPLAIYLFTESNALKQRFLEETESGVLWFNDTCQQLAAQEIPFGGKGESGYGAWFGKASFDIFTHARSCIDVPFAAEPYFAPRYPPYTQEKLDILTNLG
ncbi:aldehyde dehydrogenase [Vararia minispora EC-137]|uniref:Aldehyde dehydrogenase n=1 Tax=Vararia minispora EC-137 TaxID=1314806 RepID=A0ACB8QIU8_9AGAM|nr:aldehyde dehydrogenase [Vararia minispora EC-137]